MAEGYDVNMYLFSMTGNKGTYLDCEPGSRHFLHGIIATVKRRALLYGRLTVDAPHLPMDQQPPPIGHIGQILQILVSPIHDSRLTAKCHETNRRVVHSKS